MKIQELFENQQEFVGRTITKFFKYDQAFYVVFDNRAIRINFNRWSDTKIRHSGSLVGEKFKNIKIEYEWNDVYQDGNIDETTMIIITHNTGSYRIVLEQGYSDGEQFHAAPKADYVVTSEIPTPLNELPESEQIKILDTDHWAVRTRFDEITNPSFDFLKWSVTRDTSLAKRCWGKLSRQQLDELVVVNPELLQYHPHVSDAAAKIALEKDPRAFVKMIAPRESIQLIAVQINGTLIRCINKPSAAVQLAAVEENLVSYDLIDSPRMQVKAYAMQHKNSPKLVMDRLRYQPESIRHISNPTEEQKLVAVRAQGWIIKYIADPSPTVQLAAVNQNTDAITYLRNPTDEVKLFVLKKNGQYYLERGLIKEPLSPKIKTYIQLRFPEIYQKKFT